jgi:O-antigen biosynthesis protein
MPDEKIYRDGYERSQSMLSFLKENGLWEKGLKILDIGCSDTGLSMAWGQESELCALTDIKLDLLRSNKARFKAGPNSSFCSLAQDLPVKTGKFDAVLMNGVLEWVGCHRNADPRDEQLHALSEANRALSDDGFLYLAIENRSFPFYALQDPHIGLPLINIMPRNLAEWFSKTILGKPYRVYIYRLKHLRDMLKVSGFTNLQVYIPIYNYIYPLAFARLNDRTQFLNALKIAARGGGFNLSYIKTARRRGWMFKHIWLWLWALMGMPHFMAPTYVIIAKK